jgi:hypothetical protein
MVSTTRADCRKSRTVGQDRDREWRVTDPKRPVVSVGFAVSHPRLAPRNPLMAGRLECLIGQRLTQSHFRVPAQN